MVVRGRVRGLNTVAVIGTHLPRRCGIGTFTSDLCDALEKNLGSRGRVLAVALDDLPEGYRYRDRVRFVVQERVQSDYRLAADFLNINEIDAALLQHEFGIFGGQAGGYILSLLRRLRMPVITTLHTVLESPDEAQRRVIMELADLSSRLVVMSRRGEDMLRKLYGIGESKVQFIPHGIPDVPFVDPAFYKDKFGLEGRKVLLTFGLLSPNKGVEKMLEAMPAVVKEHPDVAYVVLGATHPHVLRDSGEEYRQRLLAMVKRLGLEKHVAFQNRFVSLDELCQYIGAADVYVTPYVNAAQVVSGTLAYTMGAGKAVVSTPYWYAQEMLCDGRGALVPFGDAKALGSAVCELLSDTMKRDATRKQAYLFCRDMVWLKVGGEYLDLAQEMRTESRLVPRRVKALSVQSDLAGELPELDLRHVIDLTDDCGVLQHAIYSTPDRRFGYATDDNARALIAMLMYYEFRRDVSVLPMAQVYLAFLSDAFNRDTKRFRNFMTYDRRWPEEGGSEDSHARALWALGIATAKAPNESVLSMSVRLFNEALPAVSGFSSPRAWAFSIIGIHAYLARFRGDAEARRARELLARKLVDLFERNVTPQWPWCEDLVTYANGRLPHALMMAGQWVPDAGMTQRGLEILEWLLKIQRGEEGQLSLIGNLGWMKRDGTRARFDQQPIDAMALLQACAEAYWVTRDVKWVEEARRCLDWFLGANDLRVSLVNFKTGGGHDGLNPQGANANCGAESTLAWLISLLTMHELVNAELLRTQAAAKASDENKNTRGEGA